MDNTPVVSGVASPLARSAGGDSPVAAVRPVSAILMDILARTDRAAVTAAGPAATEEADVKAPRP